MSAQGQPTENADAERFMRTLKEEEVYLHEYQDFANARTRIGRFLNDVYTHKRVHSALGYLPPAEFEALWRATERTTPKAASGAAGAASNPAPAAPEAIVAELSTPVTKRIS
jgi:hypothetical protein